ncbi:hypothetical protein CPAV1605_1198 [seawater metagenome]|uniref:Uncharacterized protein n=1 Tax=seawater metagenome TaxID=1561972 RepID=A0A5E8CK63_9ZZZZ
MVRSKSVERSCLARLIIAKRLILIATNYFKNSKVCPTFKGMVIMWLMISFISGVNSQVSGSNVHTIVKNSVTKNIDASGVSRFPGKGIVLGTGKPITQEIAKRIELQKVAMAMREAVKSAPTTVCTRSGDLCGKATTATVQKVFGEGIKNTPKPPPIGGSPAIPIGPAIGAVFLAKEVIDVQQEFGTKAAVIKTIGGSGTLAASLVAGTQCATMAAPAGPIASLIAGVACSLPVTLLGDHVTDQIIEQHVEIEQNLDGQAVVDDSWVPTQDQIEKCQDYLDQAKEKWDSLSGDLDLNTKRREMIKWIMANMQREDNPLMPDECEYVVLHQMLNSMNMKDLSNSDWLDMLGDGNVLFDGLSNGDQVKEDQMIRAREIVEKMLHLGIKNLRTMDGHGRFIYCFLKVLQEKGLDVNEWTLDVVDLDERVNGWHRWFLPDGILVLSENIFDMTDVDLAQTLNYFNFCGLHKQELELEMVIKAIINNGGDVFLSWSVRGGKPKRGTAVYEFALWVQKMVKRGKAEYVSHRGNFFTYSFNPKPDSRL